MIDYDSLGVIPINEDVWFEVQQPMLLWMANTPRGRDLLGLESTTLDRIDKIAKNYIRKDDYELQDDGTWMRYSTSDFRTRNKWGNIIRHKWHEFQDLASEYYLLMETGKAEYISMPVTVPVYAGTTSTFYPDADPTTTSCDFRIKADAAGAQDAWATIRATATGDVTEGVTPIQISYWTLYSLASCPNGWLTIGRSGTTFDTSSLPDTDVISAATVSWYIESITDQGTWGDEYTLAPYSLAMADPASPATGDFDAFGTTAYATAIAQSGLTTSAYNDWALNATGIAAITATGVTEIGWRTEDDANNSAPTCTGSPGSNWAVFANGSGAEQSGTSQDPKLVVTHAAPSTSGPSILLNHSLYITKN